MKIYTRIIMTVCLCGSMALGLALAQATTGSITGAVTDQTGAVIAGAMVTVRNTDTNIIRTGLSNEIGLFSFPALPIGNYEVTIEQGGFGKVVRGPVVLTLNQTAVVNAELKRGLSGLATIGATAPFVGLFGTTVGIINAFKDMSSAKAAGLSAVAGGISEALVTTAFGLFVAVPAVWAYNIFTNKVEAFSIEMTNSSSELIDYFIKQKSNKR